MCARQSPVQRSQRTRRQRSALHAARTLRLSLVPRVRPGGLPTQTHRRLTPITKFRELQTHTRLITSEIGTHDEGSRYKNRYSAYPVYLKGVPPAGGQCRITQLHGTPSCMTWEWATPTWN